MERLESKKTIAFTHDKNIHCSVNYLDCEMLPPGTEKSLARYKISGVSAMVKELSHLDSKPKVSLQFELTSSGLMELVKAEAVMEEIVIVQEEVEVDDEDDNAEESDESKEEVADEEEAPVEEEKSSNSSEASKTETKEKKKKKSYG